jgi:hypothetical protein
MTNIAHECEQEQFASGTSPGANGGKVRQFWSAMTKFYEQAAGQ